MGADRLRGLALAAGLLTAIAPPARAAAVALDDAALAQVAGRGLDGTLLRALARQDESDAAVSADGANAQAQGLAALGDLQRLQRQLDASTLRNGALGVQQAWRLTQAAFGFAQVADLAAATTIPGLQLPFFGAPFAGGVPVFTGLPVLPSLPSLGNGSEPHKH